MVHCLGQSTAADFRRFDTQGVHPGTHCCTGGRDACWPSLSALRLHRCGRRSLRCQTPSRRAAGASSSCSLGPTSESPARAQAQGGHTGCVRRGSRRPGDPCVLCCPALNAPCRQALKEALGPALDLTALPALWDATLAVRRWHSQLGDGQRAATATHLPASSSFSSGKPAAGASAARAEEEWGSGLSWVLPAHVADGSSGSSGAGEAAAWLAWPLGPVEALLPGRAAGAAAVSWGGGAGLGPSPEELRRMAVGGGGKGGGAGGGGGGGGGTTWQERYLGGGDGEDSDDVELGQEYEDGKRLREVRILRGQEGKGRSTPLRACLWAFACGAGGGNSSSSLNRAPVVQPSWRTFACDSLLLTAQINLQWLQRWAERVTGQRGAAAAAVAESAATLILLHAGDGPAAANEAVGGQLLELLGFEAAEPVSELVEQRCALVAWCERGAADAGGRS